MSLWEKLFVELRHSLQSVVLGTSVVRRFLEQDCRLLGERLSQTCIPRFRLDEVDGRSPDVLHTLRVLSRQSHDDVGGVDTNGSTGLEIGLDTSTTTSVATSADTNGRNMRSLQDDREQQHIHSFWCSSDHQ